MKFYRCKCGEQKAYSTDHPKDCEGCAKCGTTLEMHPDHHRDTGPHALELRYSSSTGEPSHWVCKTCGVRLELDWNSQGEGHEGVGKGLVDDH